MNTIKIRKIIRVTSNQIIHLGEWGPTIRLVLSDYDRELKFRVPYPATLEIEAAPSVMMCTEIKDITP